MRRGFAEVPHPEPQPSVQNAESAVEADEFDRRRAELMAGYEGSTDDAHIFTPEIALADYEEVTEETMERLEDEYREALSEAHAEFAHDRLGFLEKVVENVTPILEKMNLDTRYKVAAAFLELLPMNGFLSAYFGKRIAEVTPQGITLADMTLTERGVYLAGSLSPMPGTQQLLMYIAKHERSQEALGKLDDWAKKVGTRFYNSAVGKPLIAFGETW